MRVGLLGHAFVVGIGSTVFGTSCSTRDAPPVDDASNRFDIPAQRVVIQHDRPDLVLEKLGMGLYCLPRNGGAGGAPVEKCGVLSIDGKSSDGLDVEFPATGKDSVETKQISFRFSTREENIFCVGIKVWFQGVPNQVDSTLYVAIEDRYSILSYCTEPTLPAQHAEQSRWTHRREGTFQDFLRRLSQPIPLALRPKP